MERMKRLCCTCNGKSLIEGNFDTLNTSSIIDLIVNLDFHYDNVISTDQMDAALLHIKQLNSLEYLTIKFLNQRKYDQYSCLIASFIKECSKLRSLTIDGKMDNELLSSFTSSLLNERRQLHELRIINHRLSFRSLEDLKLIISQISSIKRLDLTQTGLSTDQMKIVASLLNDNLASLILDDNNIQINGALYLAQSLRKHKGLVQLSLQNTDIGKEGFESLTNAIEHNLLLIFFKTSSRKEYDNADDQSRLLSFLTRNQSLMQASSMHNPIRLTPLRALACRQRAWVESLDNKEIYSNPVVGKDILLPVIKTKRKNVVLLSELTDEVLSYLSIEDQQKLLVLRCTPQQAKHRSFVASVYSIVKQTVYSFFKQSR